MVIILNEENSELKGKKFPLFPGVKKHLKSVLKQYEDKKGDKTNPGYDHLSWLCDQEVLTMEEMKRIKNFFDNYKGTDKGDDFILNGGAPMRDWVNRLLDNATQVIKDQKQALKDAGADNAFRKSRTNKTKPTVDSAGVEKIDTKSYSNSLKSGKTSKKVNESRNFILYEEQVEKLKETIYKHNNKE